jgi:hypothetical protein
MSMAFFLMSSILRTWQFYMQLFFNGKTSGLYRTVVNIPKVCFWPVYWATCGRGGYGHACHGQAAQHAYMHVAYIRTVNQRGASHAVLLY